MFSNLELFYNDSIPLKKSLPQSIKDMIMLNIWDELTKDNSIVNKAKFEKTGKRFYKFKDKKDLYKYINILNEQINSIYKNENTTNKNKQSTNKENVELDCFDFLSQVDSNLWNYSLPVLIKYIHKKKDNKSISELRLFHIIQNAVMITIQTDKKGQSAISRSTTKFLKNFFTIESIENEKSQRNLKDNPLNLPNPSEMSLLNFMFNPDTRNK